MKTVERKIKVIPSGNIADISISYLQEKGGRKKIQNGQELSFIAGETMDNLGKRKFYCS